MVEVINNYTPPPPKGPVTLPDPDAPYDLNFRFPVRELESDKLKLVPFVPSIHGQALVEGMKPHPELLQYLPWDPFDTLHEFELHFEQRIRSDPTWMVYALLDKSKIIPGQVHGQLAGTIGYLRASPETASVEIGYVIVLPSYQRTFVSTHAIGLLLDYALQKPGDGGLGLRRVQWMAHVDNKPSVRAAERMGFKMEGVLRWDRTVPADKANGLKPREDDVIQLKGRHSAILSMCWDDWEGGGREHVHKMMARRS
ncbi:acyl-CoA N-acyltransferase, partial [Rhizoctonia solani]